MNPVNPKAYIKPSNANNPGNSVNDSQPTGLVINREYFTITSGILRLILIVCIYF